MVGRKVRPEGDAAFPKHRPSPGGHTRLGRQPTPSLSGFSHGEEEGLSGQSWARSRAMLLTPVRHRTTGSSCLAGGRCEFDSGHVRAVLSPQG